jgi:hypothetical protein
MMSEKRNEGISAARYPYPQHDGWPDPERPEWFGWYARLYRWSMKFIHLFGAHWAQWTGPLHPTGERQKWCHWCGWRRTAPVLPSPSGKNE